MKNIFCKCLFGLSLVLFLLTFSISVPIYCNGFYYAQIDGLNVVEQSGYSKETVKEAYGDVLAFLTQHKEFKTGKLLYSEEGKAHFKDCQRLFDLNLIVMVVSLSIVIILLMLERLKKISLISFKKFHVSFYAAILAVVLPIVIGCLCAINFDRAFVTFHHIFFTGKTNWVFDSAQDEIINILPDNFFLNCAILIGCVLVFASILIVIAGILNRRKIKTTLN